MLRCRSLLVDAILSATSAPVQIGAFRRPDVVVSRLQEGQIVAPVQNLHIWCWPHRHKRRRQVENEPMNDAAWCARVVQARTERDDLRPQPGRIPDFLDKASVGAEERARTSTALRPQAPEACASASSATSAGRGDHVGRTLKYSGTLPRPSSARCLRPASVAGPGHHSRQAHRFAVTSAAWRTKSVYNAETSAVGPPEFEFGGGRVPGASSSQAEDA
jgi:hypothetical protein